MSVLFRLKRMLVTVAALAVLKGAEGSAMRRIDFLDQAEIEEDRATDYGPGGIA